MTGYADLGGGGGHDHTWWPPLPDTGLSTDGPAMVLRFAVLPGVSPFTSRCGLRGRHGKGLPLLAGVGLMFQEPRNARAAGGSPRALPQGGVRRPTGMQADQAQCIGTVIAAAIEVLRAGVPSAQPTRRRRNGQGSAPDAHCKERNAGEPWRSEGTTPMDLARWC